MINKIKKITTDISANLIKLIKTKVFVFTCAALLIYGAGVLTGFLVFHQGNVTSPMQTITSTPVPTLSTSLQPPTLSAEPTSTGTLAPGETPAPTYIPQKRSTSSIVPDMTNVSSIRITKGGKVYKSINGKNDEQKVLDFTNSTDLAFSDKQINDTIPADYEINIRGKDGSQYVMSIYKDHLTIGDITYSVGSTFSKAETLYKSLSYPELHVK